MSVFKQGRSLPFQFGRAQCDSTRAPLVLIRPMCRLSAVPPRQVPTKEPPASPVEMPPDAPEPPSPEIPGVPPDEVPDTPPEMPQEEGAFDGKMRSSL